ncbi:MAG TPA: ABC transporter ATP-binding protein [Geminicoccaceae bacterium]
MAPPPGRGRWQAFKATPAGRLLVEHVRPQLRWLLFAGVCMTVYAGTTAAQAWIMEPMLDRVFLARDQAMLTLVPVAVIAISLLKGVVDFGQTIALYRVGQRITADLQRRLFRHLLDADVGYFIERGSGPLISSMTYDTQQLRNATSSVLTGLARDSLSIVFLTALMFHQDWRLASVAVIAFPLASFPIARLGRRMKKVAGQTQAQMASLTSRLEQTFRGMRQIKTDTREDDEAARTGSIIETLFRTHLKASRVRATTSPVMEALGGFAVAAVIYYGGSRVLAGATTPGTFFSFVTAMLLAYRPLKNLAKLNTQLQEGLAAASRIYRVLDRPPQVQEAADAAPLVVGAGAITFEHVTFGYRPGRPALGELDLEVPAGRTLALVGPSGAGKSTVLSLILRFYDPDSGRILIDGQDIRRTTLASLRRNIALVSQEVELFDDTVRANIAYGRPDASDDEIRAAAEAAAAHDFIMKLPDGYATSIGPSGASLSGGQRQRLGIARAMLKNAPILLLDEATSALDSEAERVVQMALERLKHGRTTLVIAHRLSTIIGADLIAVVENGRIVELGTHQALLASSGSYARLYELQFASDGPAPVERAARRSA